VQDDRQGAEPGALDPERWIEDHGDYLFHFALSRVRDPVKAEDLVHDALLAALRAAEGYRGRSTERTWICGILRNKILDHFRKAGRESNFTDLEFYADEETGAFTHPDFPGHWSAESAPSAWEGMGEALDNDAFWKAFEECRGKLPERVSAVFILREMDEVSSEEICRTLSITPNNLWVMLHRARMALRRCLEVNWFTAQGIAPPG
jgi:RNA polymerase sigma-70 factor (ECF subfamily)